MIRRSLPKQRLPSTIPSKISSSPLEINWLLSEENRYECVVYLMKLARWGERLERNLKEQFSCEQVKIERRGRRGVRIHFCSLLFDQFRLDCCTNSLFFSFFYRIRKIVELNRNEMYDCAEFELHLILLIDFLHLLPLRLIIDLFSSSFRLAS